MNNTPKTATGVLEVVGGGSGFLRRAEGAYTAGRQDIYVPANLIRQHGLRTGDEITGSVAPSPRRGKNALLKSVDTANGEPPERLEHRPVFTQLGATHPSQRLVLELGDSDSIAGKTNRVIDLFCPFGKGQRAMIVSPSKAGKTTVLLNVAEGIVRNCPECVLFILLVDERPEEVTEMRSAGFGEVIASSFDQPPANHLAVAEITLERARRRAELGQDVVLVLDSLTRLARAYNAVEEGTGRTLSGGIDASSLEKPKRFLGSARSIDPRQGGGSLTIIATALVDTGSRMDQVIFEEFKGTGNSELVLSRELADRRLFPAIDLPASATRREELLMDERTLEAAHRLRRRFAGNSPADAMSALLGLLRRTRSNAELVDMIMGEG